MPSKKTPPLPDLSWHPLAQAAAARATEEPRFTRLHWAARLGRLDEMVAALDAGDDIEARDTVCENTPLHYAAINGQAEAVALLLERGAQINALEAMGSTPLMYAIHARHADIAHILLDAGADIRPANKMGATAESVAAYDHDLLAAVRRAGLLQVAVKGAADPGRPVL